jgi:hypothetical protein
MSMKKIIVIVVVVLAVASATYWFFFYQPKQKDNFINTYKEILIIREQYSDTAQANPLIKKSIKKHGFTNDGFKQAYFSYAQNSKEFLVMLDSARERAKREVLGFEKKEKEKEKVIKKDNKPAVKTEVKAEVKKK